MSHTPPSADSAISFEQRVATLLCAEQGLTAHRANTLAFVIATYATERAAIQPAGEAAPIEAGELPSEESVRRVLTYALGRISEVDSPKLVRDLFNETFLSANGSHTKAELAIEWAYPSLSGMMFRAGVEAGKLVATKPDSVTGVAVDGLITAYRLLLGVVDTEMSHVARTKIEIAMRRLSEHFTALHQDTGKAVVRDVREFGAVGDGVTDDTAAFQRAADWCATARTARTAPTVDAVSDNGSARDRVLEEAARMCDWLNGEKRLIPAGCAAAIRTLKAVQGKASDAEDAARWRFVRSHPKMGAALIKHLMIGNLPLDESVDAAIAARAQQQGDAS